MNNFVKHSNIHELERLNNIFTTKRLKKKKMQHRAKNSENEGTISQLIYLDYGEVFRKVVLLCKKA